MGWLSWSHNSWGCEVRSSESWSNGWLNNNHLSLGFLRAGSWFLVLELLRLLDVFVENDWQSFLLFNDSHRFDPDWFNQVNLNDAFVEDVVERNRSGGPDWLRSNNWSWEGSSDDWLFNELWSVLKWRLVVFVIWFLFWNIFKIVNVESRNCGNIWNLFSDIQLSVEVVFSLEHGVVDWDVSLVGVVFVRS